MKIVAVCGVGVGTSAILKANAERALERLELDAEVSACGLGDVAAASADAQIVLTSTELSAQVRAELGRTFAEIVEVGNYFDVDEIAQHLQRSLG
ncbi:PTS sugar transporter subunit IIB [Agromyces aerolatus]|uniref:PTS sugar transporter subunit IIB n=1 Tax=Agromyces sp. LY-1074 TaxID=3074080 RepID=UPI002860AE01|nr:MULTISPECIES: PTS sugar transporter subunit IIB [unclassified Agromyces]MDR5700334.1 PTS sugar transporter subunit IIB [Agromyces sp. LY-1074]MDR5706688.1 PTS sugar transporter subunit IIB [Agromyces sp. LY-1358]